MRLDYYHEQREKAKLLPNGMRIHMLVYSYSVVVTIWNPKAKKPTYHYRFKTMRAASAFIHSTVQKFDEHLSSIAKGRKDRNHGDWHLADPGAIFSCTWGYEQSVLQQHKEWFAMN